MIYEWVNSSETILIVSESLILNSDLAPINSFDLGEDKKFAVVSTLNSTIKLIDLTIGDTVCEYKGFHKSD